MIRRFPHFFLFEKVFRSQRLSWFVCAALLILILPCLSRDHQDMDEAVRVSDLVAPEHLEIQTEDSQKVADR